VEADMNDQDIAQRARARSVRATTLSVAGVVATGGSTLAVINSADPGVTAPTFWAVVFFVSAQVAGVSALLGAMQALTLREATAPAELRLLTRRNVCALVASGVTMFAAGAALPGHGSAAAILVGPVLVVVASIAVFHARALIRRLDGADARTVRSPLQDVTELLHADVQPPTAASMLGPVVCLAAAAAFLRDTAEDASLSGAAVTAGIEALAVVGCFIALGRILGLR
jgi:hypothetical protein